MKQAERLQKIIELFEQKYPYAHCALDHRNAFELSVATILSAQCTDKRVNMVTPALFKKFPDAKAMSKATPKQLEKLIQSTGFFRNKAKNLLGMAKQVVEKHGGEIPDNIEDLVALPGIGRKTANVILGEVFQKPAGVVVDTHVTRLSNLLGLTKHKDAVKIEKDLNKKVPQSKWAKFSHWLIHHGREVCIARRPQCEQCFLLQLCPRKGLPKLKKSSAQPKVLGLSKSGELRRLAPKKTKRIRLQGRKKTVRN